MIQERSTADQWMNCQITKKAVSSKGWCPETGERLPRRQIARYARQKNQINSKLPEACHSQASFKEGGNRAGVGWDEGGKALPLFGCWRI